MTTVERACASTLPRMRYPGWTCTGDGLTEVGAVTRDGEAVPIVAPSSRIQEVIGFDSASFRPYDNSGDHIHVGLPDVRQIAPFPTLLTGLVAALRYRPGWTFRLADVDRGQGSRGLTLIITVATTNSYPPYEPIAVQHFMPVPPAAYDTRSWRRWLFDQCQLVDTHEGCEFFEIDGDKPYAPHHQPGANPYVIHEIGTDEERRTSYLGELS
jgi:hypothetical protein